MEDLIFRNTMTRLYNIGREELKKAIESGTWNGIKQKKPYIYSRSVCSLLQDNSNIRCLSYLPLVETDDFGAFIPEYTIGDYLKAKEDPEADFWPELEEVEHALDEIEEACETIRENGLLDEDDYMEEENKAREEEAEKISNETGIPFEKCMDFLLEKAWIECMSYIEYYREDLTAFIESYK